MSARRRLLPLLAATVAATAASAVLTPVGPASARAQVNLPTQWNHLSGTSNAWIKQYVDDTTSLDVYAATYGEGVLKSTNDGATWAPFYAGLPDGSSGTGATDGATAYVYTIYLSGGKVYAGTNHGIYASATGSAAFMPVGSGDNPDPAHPTKLNDSVQAVFSPKLGSMLAGTVSDGVWTSSDSGQTWKPPAEGNGMPDSETTWAFASFQGAGGAIFAATSDGIYRSIDAGSTWTPSNDGISGVTLRIFADGKYPNIYYATGSGGIFRSVNGGTSWTNINGTDPNHEIVGDPTIRDLITTTSANTEELFAATGEGIWAGSEPLNATGKGPVLWRHLDETGLHDAGPPASDNTIFWTLFTDLKTPTFIDAGTQSNGGYVIELVPPVNNNVASGKAVDLPQITGKAVESSTLTATPGNWSGTQPIEFTYQWQLCTSTSTGSCTDIDKATQQTYTIPATDGTTAGDQNEYLRVTVTGTNDTPGTKVNSSSASSALTGKIAPKPGSEPGATQHVLGEITVKGTPAIASQITSGDTVQYLPKSSSFPQGYFFNPASTSDTYQWLRCDNAGDIDSCVTLVGQTAQTYKVIDADVTDTLCVNVTGSATTGSGVNAVTQSTTLYCNSPTAEVLPAAAQPVPGGAPSVLGHPYVGASVTGNAGNWGSVPQTFTFDWAICTSPTDLSSCETEIDGSDGQIDKTNTYTPTSDDLGQYLRFEVTADPNGPNKLPLATDLLSAASVAITNPPPPPTKPVVAQPGPVAPIVTPPAAPQPPPPAKPVVTLVDRTAPTLSSAKLAAGSIITGAADKLAYKVSEAGRLKLLVEHSVKGHLVGRKCSTSSKVTRGKVCTVTTTVASTYLTLSAGSHTLTLGPKIGGKVLPPGTYALVIQPIDAHNNAGRTSKIIITVKPKPKPRPKPKPTHRAF